MNAASTILAVGAGGKNAGLLIPELVKRGARVRALVHKQDDVEKLKKAGVAEIAIGELHRRADVEQMLKGVSGVYYIAPAFMPDEAAIGVQFVERAKAAGVERFVFSSVIHPELLALVNHRAKLPVEDALIKSGMEHVLLHPAVFFQNYQASFAETVKSSVLAEPWSPETKFSRVDYRDVAEVAAIALTEDRLAHGTYQLCAEGQLNRREVAKLLSEVLKKPIDAGTLDLEKAIAGPEKAGKDDVVKAMLAMFAWYDHDGLLGNALTLRAILGREPRTLKAYFEELAVDESLSL